MIRPDPDPEPVNGNRVELHYGDVIVPLEDRLEAQDREVRFLKRILIALGALLVFHVAFPGEDVLSFLLKLLGL